METQVRAIRPVLWLVLLAIALPAAAGVQVDWDQKASFAGYKTYAWRPGTPAKSELNQARIEKIVNAELAGKGLAPKDDAPDLLVVTHVSRETRQELRVNDYGYAYGPGYYHWGGYGDRDYSDGSNKNYEENTPGAAVPTLYNSWGAGSSLSSSFDVTSPIIFFWTTASSTSRIDLACPTVRGSHMSG